MPYARKKKGSAEWSEQSYEDNANLFLEAVDERLEEELFFDSEEDFYFDALNSFDEQFPSSTLHGGQDSTDTDPSVSRTPVASFIWHIIGRTLFSIQLRLFSRMAGIEELYADVRSLAQSREPVSARLLKLSQLLLQHVDMVPEHYRSMLRHAVELTGLGISLCQLHNIQQDDLSDRIRRFADQAEYMISLEVIRVYLPAQELSRLAFLPEQLRKMASLLKLHQFMPEDSSFDEWLRQLSLQEVFPELIKEGLLRYTELSEQLRELRAEMGEINELYPLPAEEDWVGRVNWAQQVLNDPIIARQLKPYLPTTLAETVNISVPLIQLASGFPAGNSLAEQLVWTGQQVIAPSPELLRLITLPPFSEFVTSARKQLSDKIINPALFNTLLELAAPGPSLWHKSVKIISLFFPVDRLREAILSALRLGVRMWLPGGDLLINAWDWYQTLPEGLSWQDTLERFTADLQEAVYANPQMLREVLPDNILAGAEALSELINLPSGKSWQEILHWASVCLGRGKEYDWLYQRYVELSLARGVYEALKQGDINQREAVLRDIAESLKDYLALRSGSGLNELLDLLPYLPLLAEMREEITAMSGNDAWLGRATNILKVLEKHPHPTLTELRMQLESQIVNFLSNSIIAGIDSLWEQLPTITDPLRFPGAEAAPTQRTSYTPGTFWTKHKQIPVDSKQHEQPDEKTKVERKTEETESDSSAKNKELIMSFDAEDQLLDDLLTIADGYERGYISPREGDDNSHLKQYAIIGGLTAGWMITLYLFWRVHRKAGTQHAGHKDIEMQAFSPRPQSENPEHDDTEKVLLAPPPSLSEPVNKKKYLLPSILLAGMSGLTAWEAWQTWGSEKPLTLQEAFREFLNEEASRISSELPLYPEKNHVRNKRSDLTEKTEEILENKDIVIDVSLLVNLFERWNVTSDTYVKDIIKNFINKLKMKNEEIQKSSIIIYELIAYMLTCMSTMVNIQTGAEEEKQLTEQFVSMIVFIEKGLKKINTLIPNSHITDNLRKTLHYGKIINYINRSLILLLNKNKNTPARYILYKVLQNGILFNIRETPELKKYFDITRDDYEKQYPGGAYKKQIYKLAEDFIYSFNIPTSEENDVIQNKESALRFLLDKHGESEDAYTNKRIELLYIWQDIRELISFTAQKIINNLSSDNHDLLIKKAELEFITTGAKDLNNGNRKDYSAIWDTCRRSSFETVSFYSNQVNKREGNIYLLGSVKAINKLLQDREYIRELMIKNFTKPDEANQQCALFFLISRQINKISNYKDELQKILDTFYEIESNPQSSLPFHRLNVNDFGFKSAIDDLKVEAVLRLTKKINKYLDYHDAIKFYDFIINDTSENNRDLRESIQRYIKAREYMFFIWLSFHGLNSEGKSSDDIIRNISLQNFNSFNRSVLEKEALSYLITPLDYESYTPIEQIKREASSILTTSRSFYRLYNEYIDNDSLKEAKDNAFYLIMRSVKNIESLSDVFEKPKSVESFKLHASVNKLWPASIVFRLECGNVYIITLKDDKKYILITFFGLTEIFICHKKNFHLCEMENEESLNSLFINIYQGEEVFKHLMEFISEIKSWINSIKTALTGKVKYKLTKQTEYDLLKKPLKDIIIDESHNSLKKVATALREQGYITPQGYILNLIPFYAAIKRLSNDSQYHPTAGDLAWDIADTAFSLGLVGGKILYKTTMVIKSILEAAEKSLSVSSKTLQGSTRYLAVLKLSAPEIIKRFPSMQKILKETITFTADMLNPLGPFILIASPAVKLGKTAFKKIPRRISKRNNTSFVTPKNVEPSGGETKAFGEDDFGSFKYIDELSDEEISEATNKLPPRLLSDPTLRSYSTLPEGQCDKAAERVISILSENGYDIRVIGTLAYKNVLDTSPLNHYAVIAIKNGTEIVIDVTFEQFTSRLTRRNEMFISSWEEWCRKITASDKLINSCIMIKEYKTLSAAKREISLTDNRTYIESSYVKDPEFHTILAPPLFLKNLGVLYERDVKKISTYEGVMDLILVDNLISKNQKKLFNLLKIESDYLDKNTPAPGRILDDIEKTRRSIKELESLKSLPDRISNYIYLSKTIVIKPEERLLFQTPLSFELKNAMDKSKIIPVGNVNNVKLINERGLAEIEGHYYFVYNEKLYPLNTSTDSPVKGTVIFPEHTVDVEYKNFKWDFVGNTYRNIDQTVTEKLISGSTSPLRKRGLLNVLESTPIDTPFEYVRIDKQVSINTAKKFTHTELNGTLRGKISTNTGNKLSSKTAAGPVLGKWKEGDIGSTIDFIKVSNGSSGCVGIKIPFDQIPAERPVIVSAGQLSGCTMVYATDDKYFYAYHTGQEAGDKNWLTSQQGVDEIYNAHLALKGTTIPSLTGKRLTNQDLPTIFSDYSSSLVTYLGKDTPATGNTRIPQNSWSNVNTFDYNRYETNSEQSRLGLAYAILNKKDNNVTISAYSEDLSINIKSGELTPVASNHQLLKGKKSSFDESIFKISIDTVEDAYTSFVAARKIRDIINTASSEITPPQPTQPAQPRRDDG